MKNIKIIQSIIVMGIFLLFAAASIENEEKPQKVDNRDKTKVESAKSDFKIGDKIQFSKYVLQVTNVEISKIYNQAWEPEKGKKFVAVEVLINNTSKESVDYNILSGFDLVDEYGYEYSFAVFGVREPSLSAGDIPPGRKTRGWITFEVEKGSKEFEFVYSPGFFSSQKFYISLQE